MNSSEYEAMYNSEDKLWWYIGLREVLDFYISKFGNFESKILDAGCGTGKNTEYFLNKGYKNITSVEYSKEAIEFCKRRGLNNVIQGSITDLPFKSESFDIIYCTDVLYIFEEQDRKKAVNELYRILRKDGILIINSAAFEFLRSQHDDVINTKKRFTRIEHSSLLDDFDVQIIKSSYRVFFLFPLMLAFRFLKKLLKSKHESSTDQGVFPFGINWVFTKIQQLENVFFKRINFPFGSSVFLVVKKN